MHKYVYWPVDDFQVFPAAALEPIDLNDQGIFDFVQN